MSTLTGKTAVVTGASSGIGRAIAERLGSEGASVYLAGRTTEAMEQSRERIEGAGGKATVSTFDIRDLNALRALVNQAGDETGRLDVMVNNAAIDYRSSIIDGNAEQWREMLEVNILAVLVGCQTAVTTMRRVGSVGHIVNTSSVAALRRESGVYGATKHAINTIGASLREELEDDDIRVVTVMPGLIATNFGRNMEPEVIEGIATLAGVELEHKRGDKIPDEVLEKAQAALERHIAKPEDIADAVAYAVNAPLRLNISELVVRPAKSLQV